MRGAVGRSHWEAPVALEDVQKLHEQPCAKDLAVDGAFCTHSRHPGVLLCRNVRGLASIDDGERI